MNLPNKLTLSRLILSVVFIIVLFSRMPFAETIALCLFGIASLTDYFDGKIARQNNLITNFGKLMDPLADKILICSAFIGFVGLHQMPAWMVVIVVARELAITGLRLLAASKQVVLAAEGYGKHKTISQIVAILAILILMSYKEWGTFGQLIFGWTIHGAAWVDWVAVFSKWVAVLLTLLSGSIYLWRNRELYLRDM
jgi:CDP-diacylglycerol---glycerol-3-phosphate 3-phosphatidyltransferase